MSESLAPAHYPKVDGFVRRTAADFTVAELRTKSLDHYFKLDLAPPRPEQPLLIGSCMGRIDRILLTIPSYAARDMKAAYMSLLAQLPATTRLSETPAPDTDQSEYTSAIPRRNDSEGRDIPDRIKM